MDYDPEVFGADQRSFYDKSIFPDLSKEFGKAKPAKVSDFSGNLRIGPLDTGLPLPDTVNKGLAQFGSGLSDYGTRISQLFGGANEGDVERKRMMDAALVDSMGGKALRFAGKALPIMAAPQITGHSVLSGAMAGGLAGMMEPVGQGESGLSNAALGAGLGVAIPGAFDLARKTMMKPDAVTQAATALADKYGIPYSWADLSSNGFVKGARSLTNDLPVVGLPGATLKANQQTALNEAVGGTIGIQGGKRLTPDVMDAAYKRMGSEFDRIWGQNSLTVDAPLFQQLQSLRASAADLPAEQARRIITKIDDFWSHAQPGQNGAPTVTGDTANAFQKWLRETAPKSQSSVSQDMGSLRQSIIDAFNRSIGPNEAAALTANRAQYKAWKTVEPLLEKGVVASAGRAEGDIPAALLPEAVRRSYSGLAKQTDQPALAEISQAASRLIPERTPLTGGSPRAMLQNAGLLGTAAGMGAAPVETTLGLTGSGLVNAILNSPRLGRAIAGSAPQRSLLGGPQLDANEMTREALRLMFTRAPLGLLSSSLPATE